MTWPNKNAFEKFGGQRTAVDGHEHLVGARGVGVDGFGNQFLTGSGFAIDQDGSAAGGDLGHLIEQAQHFFAFADNVGKGIALFQGALELGVFTLQAALEDHAVNLNEQFVVIPRLGEIIVGA